MQGMRGLLHTTSIDAANDQKTTFAAHPVAGVKRSWSSEAGSNSNSSDPRSTVQFHRAISLPSAPPRLSASRIVELQPSHGVSEYSQRRLIAATPTASCDPELLLSHPTYGLPKQLVDNFAALGIQQIYPWQKTCLKGPGLLTGEKNLVYCAPTGGGKSLVADRLRYADDPNADETKGIWRRRADDGIVRIVGFFGGGKANALVNTAIDDCSIPQLRAVVLDELHMIDDDHRGYLLELTATKLLSLEQSVQIIGMSATLPNMDLMAQWLNGHCYETRYRPVPIEEHLVYNGNAYLAGSTRSLIKTATQLHGTSTSTQGQPSPIRRIEPSTHKEFRDPVLNSVVTLAHETASTGYGALVFAGSRGVCEADARWISRVMPPLHEMDPVLVEKRMDLLEELRSLNTGLDPVLGETVLFGVAFHHAGLTSEERDLIAAAYDDGVLLVVELMHAELPKVASCLNTENRRIQRLEEMETMGFITEDSSSMFTATQLGKAIVASAIDPDDGVFVHKELSRALRAFVMDGDMHILYTFTPVQEFGITVNWQVFRNEMEALDESGLRVLNILGMKPTTVVKLAQGASLREVTQQEKDLARVYRRFYLALQLRDLCNEVPIHAVARKYDVHRGTVQNLAQTCQGFAAGMIKFCEQMGWGRVFWENGFRTIATIADADPMELLPVLMQAQPNKIRLKGKDNEKYEEKLMIKAKVISESANKLWQIDEK
ncbi:hypothetical protein EDB81DRAFT_753132 [Dactylonectria macrodidyma]|uniref:Helicase ATP-binding domain-containing protein n=1 Tax=Dactylonectria macrodidyma TaxID=307937 RepID=A0A9P9FQA1_9HYPO|nr:hypothetical protein EDB81DRAFT_753132 [Dactylonectria macrodidyma]